MGLNQCYHLIKCNVPLIFIQFAIDDLPTMLSSNNNYSVGSSSSTTTTATTTSPSLSLGHNNYSINSSKNNNNSNNNGSSQFTNLTKLFCVTSMLLRCYDMSSYCCSSLKDDNNNVNHELNPYSLYNELKQNDSNNDSATTTTTTEPLQQQKLKMSPKIEEYIFKRTSYLKKVLEDAPSLQDNIKLLKFLSWENMEFSLSLIKELLWLAAYHYSYELKPHLDLLYHILIINDSWQTHRLSFVFQNNTSNDNKESLFEIIIKSQNHYQKRAYQIIKMLVQLFSTCVSANELLNKDDDLKSKWKQSRNWFYNEMEKCRLYNMPNYSYFQATQSNETSQTCYLERTQSARLTLEKAMKICPPQNLINNNNQQQHHQTNESDNQQTLEERISILTSATSENVN
jgi:ubiquitin carboxyl-terminal hydrolase 9/24